MNGDAVCDAKQLLLKAELDAAENEADRIKLYEKFVDTMKEIEERAKALKLGAQGTDVGVLKAKAIRLEAEIALEQAKAKMAQ